MKKYRFYAAIAFFFVAVVGCKDYLDINTNPNAPTVTVPDLVLSGALVETARIKDGNDMNNYAPFWAGYWSASGTYSSSGDTRRFFNLTNNSNTNVWTDNYLNASNYNFVQKSSSAIEGYDYFVAIATIMKVYNFQLLIDNYGNVPYSEALTGFTKLSPKYDDASVVYEKLSAQLDSAIELINNAPANAIIPAATVDVMFQGDMLKWQQLANTMNLRLLIHQSEVASKQAFIDAELAKIVANGKGYLTVDALINPGYAKATGLQNPLWEANGLGVGDDVGGRDYNRSSAYGLAFFVNHNDPRIDALFRNVGDQAGVEPDGPVTYKGIPFGADPDVQYTTVKTSGPGLGVMPGPDNDVNFLSLAQTDFLLAEAMQRGWTTGSSFGSVQEAYEAGVTASFAFYGLEAEAPDYLTNGQPLVDFSQAGSSNEILETILVQKWAAGFTIDGMEAYTDKRRTGIPTDLPQSEAAAKINDTPPIRLLYPQSELSNNAGAVTAALSAQGLSGNYQFSKPIFWDVDATF